MVILDATIVNVALPSIGRDLGGGVSGLQWVVDAYTVVFAGLLLSAGSIGDRLGARRVLDAGLGLFTAASAACALAPSVTVLVGARAAQGLGRRAAGAELAGAAAGRIPRSGRAGARGRRLGCGGRRRCRLGPDPRRTARRAGQLARGVHRQHPGRAARDAPERATPASGRRALRRRLRSARPGARRADADAVDARADRGRLGRLGLAAVAGRR